MAGGASSIQGFLLRLIGAAILVFATWNPSGTSYVHWVADTAGQIAPEKVLVGLILLIGWLAYIRAGWNSLGLGGLVLTLAFFGTILWLVVDRGLVSPNNRTVMAYLIEVILVFTMAIGMSWAFVRRRLSGQYVDTD